MTLRTVTIGHCALAKSKPGGARQEWPAAFKKAYPALVSGFNVERKWVITRGGVNHGPTGELAELWRLRPSAGRPIGRPLRCGVFDIALVAWPDEGLVRARCKVKIYRTATGTPHTHTYIYT